MRATVPHLIVNFCVAVCLIALAPPQRVLLASPAADTAQDFRTIESRFVFIDFVERPVREFLKLHFAGSRSFSPSGLDKKKNLLTRRFRSGIFAFFSRAMKSDSAPPLVMDPFTGSMGATDYSFGKPRVRGEKAWVPVNFTDGTNRWTITFLLRNDQERGDDRWRIDDIQDVRGMLLSDVLKR